jgi:hypothetical protein
VISLGDGVRVRDRYGSILAVWLSRVVLSFVVAYPIARAVGATGATSFADGDRVLFQAGGARLIDSLRAGDVLLVESLRTSVVIAVLAAMASLLPLTALVVALDTPGKLHAPAIAAKTLVVFPRFAVLTGLAVLAQAVVSFMGGSAAYGVADAFRGSLSERGADLLFAFVVLVFGVLVGLLGVTQDLARAVVVRTRAGVIGALSAAAATLAGRPIRTVGTYLGLVTPVALAIVGSAWLTALIDVGRPGPWRVVLVLAIHQAVVLASVACRAAWFSYALGVVGGEPTLPPEPSPPPPLADTLARNDAPGGPTRDPAA